MSGGNLAAIPRPVFPGLFRGAHKISVIANFQRIDCRSLPTLIRLSGGRTKISSYPAPGMSVANARRFAQSFRVDAWKQEKGKE